ncbi:MAG: hypothetical protein JW822_10655 [Spirochaetales bacterium]|nr:hypothetical protein [Spirochaetales bacterium]
MNKAHGTETKLGFGDKLAQVIQKNRFLIFLVTIAIIVGLVFFLVWVTISEQIEKSSTQKAEELQERYDKWKNEYDTEKNKQYKQELVDFIETVIDEYPNTLACQRALFTRFYMTREDALVEGEGGEKQDKSQAWLSMLDDMLQAVKANPHSYLAEMALYNAAVIIEEIDYYQKEGTYLLDRITQDDVRELIAEETFKNYEYDLEQLDDYALALYIYFAKTYPEAVDYPHVLLSTARLLETKLSQVEEKGDSDSADQILARIREIYLELELDFEKNDWTKIAKNRNIMLKIQEGETEEQEE